MAVRTESTTHIAQELVRAWNAHDLDAVTRLHAPNYVGTNVGTSGPTVGPEAARRSLESYFVAFPDLGFQVEDTVAQDDRVVLVWRARGTHEGPLMHIPPTGRSVDVRGVSVLSVQDGHITRGMHMWDVAGLLRELKLLPDLP